MRRVLSLAAVALAACLGAAAPADAIISSGSNTFEFANGAQQRTFGPNAEVELDKGTLRYSAACALSGSEAFAGENDFFTTISDVYLVRAGSVANEGDKLEDVVQTANAFGGGGGQNTVISLGGAFVNETIAYTKPGGNLPPGRYDMVFDTCQNQEFDPDDDTVFPFAVTVQFPAEIRGNLGSPTEIQDIKETATLSHTTMYTAYVVSKGLLDSLELLEKHKECRSGNLYFCLLAELAKDYAEEKALQLTGVMKVKEATLNLWNNIVKAHRGIANDPPDPAFQQVTKLDPVAGPAPTYAAGVEAASGPLADALALEAALAQALLRAMERYQGAQRAANADWALVHARQARDLARALSARQAQSRAAIEGLRALIEAETHPDADDAAKARRDGARQLVTGVDATQRRALMNLGLTTPQINEIEQDAGPDTLPGQSPPTRGAALGALATARDGYVGAAAGYAAFGDDIAALVTDLEAQATEERFAPQAPVADAGGPYAPTEGLAFALNGSASRATAGTLVAHRWDLDLDGQFDDALGATPSVTLTRAGGTVIGLEVEASNGRRAVAYVPLTVAAADAAPQLQSATPDDGVVTVTTGATRAFSVTASDPDGHPVTVQWRVDGAAAGTGAAFDYQPGTGDVGLHVVEAIASDGRATGGEVRRRWSVRVLRPDADGDQWHANVDCDDTSSAVRPQRSEVFGNGVDDDCDTGTADVPPGGIPGRMLSWGHIRFGQLGDGSMSHTYGQARTTPAPVVGLEDAVDASGGHEFSLAVRADGTAWSWGFDVCESLGNGDGVSQGAPSPVAAVGVQNPDSGQLMGVTDIEAAGSCNHGYALRQDGTVVGWGWHNLGDNTTSARPAPVLLPDTDGEGPLDNATAIFRNNDHAWALVDGGQVAYWGQDVNGCEAVTNDNGDWFQESPRLIPSVGSGVIAVSGMHQATFLKADGEVLSCTRFNPAQRVQGLGPGSGVVQIAGGHLRALALKQDGTVLAWGEDRIPATVALPAGPKVVRIAAGPLTSFAIRADGSALAWGQNHLGQLGIGTTDDPVTTPTPVVLPAGVEVRQIAPGGVHTLAIVGDAPTEPPAPALRLSVADVEVSEAAGTATLTVTRSTASSLPSSFDYTTSAGSAAAGSDFTTTQGTGTIPADATQTTIQVPVANDPTDEDAEAFTLQLSNPSVNSGIADGTAAVAIADDDDPPALSLDDAAAAPENDVGSAPALSFAVRLARASTKPIAVRYGTQDGSGTADDDFRSAHGELEFAPGQTEKTVTVDVVGDHVPESDETAVLTLSEPVGAPIADSSATGAILDDDPFVLSASGATVTEGDAGTRDLTFTVRVAPVPAAGQQVTVAAATVEGTAAAPADFAARSQTLTFGPGEGTRTVTVPVAGDTAFEGDERLGLRLLSPAATGTTRAVQLMRSTVLGTIDDDDAAPARVNPPAPRPAPAPAPGTPPRLDPPVLRPPLPPALKAEQIVRIPASRRCVSRRRFRITLKAPAGVRLRSATVRIGRRKTQRVSGRKLSAPVDLRDLPAGRFSVVVTVQTADGRSISLTRRYRTCAPKRKGPRGRS